MLKNQLSPVLLKILFVAVLLLFISTVTAIASEEEAESQASDITISLTEAERVVMGGTVVVEVGELVKKLVVIGGTAEVRGTVEELVIVGGYLKLKSTAKVVKDLVLVGGYMDRHPDAKVSGKLVNIMLPVSEEGWAEITKDLKKRYLDDYLAENQWVKYTSSLIKILVLLSFAGVGWFLAPGLMKRTSVYLRQNFVWCGVIGIGTTLLVLPITMFLILSLVGIPLLPLQFSLLILFVIYGEIHIATWITHWFIGKESFHLLAPGWG
jgi:hypothetical protein